MNVCLRVLLVTSVAIFLASSPHRVLALDPQVHLSQYGHSAWRVRDGHLPGAPQAFAQTTDGYLWIGTANGLVRFDGSRFEPFHATEKARLPAGSILALMAARDGSLWIGSLEGLARFHQGSLVAFAGVKGAVQSIIDDTLDAEVWLARSRVKSGAGPLCRIKENEARCFGKPDGIPVAHASHVVKEAGGAIWVSGTDALVRWDRGESATYFRKELAGHENLDGVSGLAIGPDGAIWTALPGGKGGLSLQKFQSGQWTQQSFAGSGADVAPTTLFMDSRGALWIGTDSHGVFRLVDSKLEQFDSANGLTGDRVSAIFEDGEGNIWTATSAGIDCFRNLAVLSFSKREGLSSDDATAVQAQDDGTVWVGNGAHLDRIDTAHGMHASTDSQVVVHQVTAIADGGEGRLWVGADQDMLIHENGRTEFVKRATGLPIGGIEVMAVEPGRDAWLMTLDKSPKRIIHMRDDAVISDEPATWWILEPDPDEGLWLAENDGRIGRIQKGRITELSAGPGAGSAPMHVREILPTRSGSLWMATREGLVEFASGTYRRLDESNGLPCANLFALKDDLAHALWLYAACGVIRIDAGSLERWQHDPAAHVPVSLFDVLDGAEPAMTDFSPHATRSPDGRIWFVNGSIVQMVDPAQGVAAPSPPPIHIERAVGDHRTYPVSTSINFPALTRDIEFDYSAPSFAAPQKVSFRYRLDGHEDQWQEAGARRQAFYNDIVPGNYTFEVMARNADGAWSEPASLAVHLAAAWYQTRASRVAFAVFLLLLAFGLYRARLRRVEALIRSRFEGTIDERERIARDLHDTLLQSIQGLVLHLHRLATKLAPDDAIRLQLEGALRDADSTLEEGRDRVQGMRSQADTSNDLGDKFERLCGTLASAFPMRFTSASHGSPVRIQPVVADEIYLIGREAMINAARHSNGSLVEVSVTYGSAALELRVVDDGVGFPDAPVATSVKAGHFGVPGMQERARSMRAQLRFTPRSPRGTEVQLRIPARVAFMGRGGLFRKLIGGLGR